MLLGLQPGIAAAQDAVATAQSVVVDDAWAPKAGLATIDWLIVLAYAAGTIGGPAQEH